MRKCPWTSSNDISEICVMEQPVYSLTTFTDGMMSEIQKARSSMLRQKNTCFGHGREKWKASREQWTGQRTKKWHTQQGWITFYRTFYIKSRDTLWKNPNHSLIAGWCKTLLRMFCSTKYIVSTFKGSECVSEWKDRQPPAFSLPRSSFT